MMVDLKSAKKAYKSNLWSQVDHILKDAFESSADILPNHSVGWLAIARKNLGDYAGSQLACEEAIARGYESYLVLRTYAEVLFWQSEHIKALPYFEKVLYKFEEVAGGDFERKYYVILSELSNEEAAQSKWRATGGIAKIANRSYKHLLKGRVSDAKEAFYKALARRYSNEEIMDTWKQSFDSVSRIIINEPAKTSRDDERVLHRGASRALNKVTMCGMGWSGSSAIFDYFSEFHQIKPVSGEFRFIEGKYGALDLSRSILTRKESRSIVAFFALHCFGFDKRQDRSWAKSARYARRLSGGKKAVEAAKFFRSVFSHLEAASHEGALSRETLGEIIDGYLYFISGEPDEGTIPVFDNIIHMNNLEAVSLATNMTAICSVRDPRSTYVARIRENEVFKDSAEMFAQKYRRKREVFLEKMAIASKYGGENSGSGSAIETVQFENFVLSRSYRQDLARKVGLDFSRQDEYSGFKPWVSEKNVFNFESYENQDEIRLIERELADYCVDVHALKRESDNER